MKKSLPTFVLPSSALAIIAFLLVLPSRRILPEKDFPLISKIIAAAVTIKVDKFAELAAEPGSLDAIGRLFFWLLMLFIILVPIIVYHFRFKRTLFNFPKPPLAADLKYMTIGDIWKQRRTSSNSLYDIENRLFTSLGEPVVCERPIDQLAIIVAYGYYALGPGLSVGVFAAQVFTENNSAGRLFFFVAGVNILIGLGMVVGCIHGINQRSRISQLTRR
jgi:hypothetical protein